LGFLPLLSLIKEKNFTLKRVSITRKYNEQSGAHAEKKLMMKNIQLIRDYKG